MSRIPSDDGVDRRTYLAAIAGAGAAGLAGCSEDDGTSSPSDGGSTPSDGSGSPSDGSSGNQQGERVPELVYEFTTGLGNWSAVEQSTANIASTNITERLGVPVTARAKEATTMWQEHIHDSRNAHLYASGWAPNPAGLDPNLFMSLYHIQYAGNVDGYNKSQYASCEFSNLAEEQYFAADPQERRDLVHQAMGVFSDDVVEITTFPLVGYTGVNTDHLVIDDELIGEQGPGGYNYNFMTGFESKIDGPVSLNVATAVLNTTVHALLTAPLYHGYWASLVYSPLMKYDQNYNLVTDLAADFEVAKEFKEVTFTLKDHTFTNGDPVTAEDVVFTYDLYNTQYDGFGAANDMAQGSEVTAIDEKTVQFTFEQSQPTFMRGGGTTFYGILPKSLWQEKLGGDFSNLPNMELAVDEIVGSGPFKPTSFEANTILQLTPNEDHYNPGTHDFNLRAYTSPQAAYRAFQQGNLSIFGNASGSMAREIEKKDNRYVNTGETFTMGSIAPQMSFPPFQFREMRLAASQAINRREANTVALHGDSTPMLHSNFVAPSHPFYPDNHEGLTKIAPSPTGSKEAARKTLEDAGYTWDDEGRLRYPSDKDLTPPWPQGEKPMDYPEKWPCVETIPEGY